MLLRTLGYMYLFRLVFSFSLDIYSAVELLSYMVVLLLVFKAVATVFHCDCTNLHSHHSAQELPFSHILTNICYLCSFYRCQFCLKVWSAFLWWLLILSIFSCARWPSVCCLWKNIYSGFLPIFKAGYLFVWCWVVGAVYIFWISTPAWSYHCQVFSLVQKVVFSFCRYFPLLCKSLIGSHLFILVFVSFALKGWSRKVLLVCQRVFSVLGFLFFMVSGLTLRSLIHFDFIFVCSERKSADFVLLHEAVWCCLLPIVYLPPLSWAKWPHVWGYCWPLFSSTVLCMFCAIMFWWLNPCSIVWNQGV